MENKEFGEIPPEVNIPREMEVRHRANNVLHMISIGLDESFALKMAQIKKRQYEKHRGYWIGLQGK